MDLQSLNNTMKLVIPQVRYVMAMWYLNQRRPANLQQQRIWRSDRKFLEIDLLFLEIKHWKSGVFLDKTITVIIACRW
jgi:hypothetical protein